MFHTASSCNTTVRNTLSASFVSVVALNERTNTYVCAGMVTSSVELTAVTDDTMHIFNVHVSIQQAGNVAGRVIIVTVQSDDGQIVERAGSRRRLLQSSTGAAYEMQCSDDRHTCTVTIGSAPSSLSFDALQLRFDAASAGPKSLLVQSRASTHPPGTTLCVVCVRLF